MRVLVACEESGVLTSELLRLGHDAWSCDVLPTSGPHPERHLQGDVLPRLGDGWDAVIAFPPCTHLAASGARWFAEKQADGRQGAALRFVEALWQAPVARLAIENPIGVIPRLSSLGPASQIVHPWEHGHGESKATCLWIRGLPLLQPTDVVEGREQRIWRMGESRDRARLRSRTYPGIARAMALQWFGPAA